jgi:CMP-N,N'-diacetyllegionaminic acid synthase
MRLMILIPARAGSKGIPRKNLREVYGRPLIAWSIDHAIESANELQHAKAVECGVVVSTDSEEIAEVARACGASVLMRPAELATDGALTDPVIVHAVRQMDCFPHAKPDLVALLQPTTPVRRRGLLTDCVLRLIETGADSLFTAYPLHFVWWRETPAYSGGGDRPVWRSQSKARPRRQDLEARELMYHEDGAVYVSTAELIRTTGKRIGPKAECFETSRTVDIDTLEDLAVAEAMLERIGHKPPRPKMLPGGIAPLVWQEDAAR